MKPMVCIHCCCMHPKMFTWATATFLLLATAVVATASGSPELDAVRVARNAILHARDQVWASIVTTHGSGHDNLTPQALGDCAKLYDDSEGRLRRLLAVAASDDFGGDDARAWLSGVAANHRTCLDGLEQRHSIVAADHRNLSVLIGEALGFYAKGAKKGKKGLGKGDNARRRRPVAFSGKGLLSSWDATTSRAHIVVAKDGSGNYLTINSAVNALSKMGQTRPERAIVYIKSGIYNENVEIDRNLRNVMFAGDGIDKTIVTGHRNVPDGVSTYSSATFGVSGDGFWARDMTFENTAGPRKQQAVALRVNSDRSVFYRCSFKGYQDTLFLHSLRQFYRDCKIHGTIDFMFGDAAAVLQNCDILVRKPLDHQANMITAQGRDNPDENTGIAIHQSRVVPSPELVPVKGSVRTYLGRPWRRYSRTVIMKTYLDGLVDPKGWREWSGDFALSTLFYGEYMNLGIGASVENRVAWPGFHVLREAGEISPFTVGGLIQGESWIPVTGVPFIAGV